jgi:hypothetical protein
VGLLDGIKSFFAGISSGEMYVMYIYVRCRRCGEIVAIRMDRRFDLEQEFGETLVIGYMANKDVLGRKCNNLMRVHIEYDSNFKQRNFEVEGGILLTKKEYEAETSGI